MTASPVAAEDLLAHRPMLFGLAYRLLGSAHDAEDVLQEAYLRWVRVERGEVREPRRYLARVVTRLSLDALRARQARRESYVGTWLPEPVPTGDHAGDLESLSIAMLHLLERLSPPERAVYVLRTAFGFPYAEIADLLDRQPEHCRQLHHRAATALQDGQRRFAADRGTHERLLTSFVAAARDGDLPALTDLLHADVVAWSDGGGRARAARNPVRGAPKVARFFAGILRRPSSHWKPAGLNGGPALLLTTRSGTYPVMLAAADGRISDFYLVVNPDKLTRVQASVGGSA